MIRKPLRNLAFVSLFMSATAFAGDHDAVKSLSVDMDAVVEAGAVQPVDGVTSSGQPSEEALQVFSDSGYVAVIDLRGESEDRGMENQQAVVEELGMDYVALPIASRDGVSFENAERLDSLLEQYDGPVLVHCGSGNRVGALLALRESLNGASDEEALEYGREGGLTRLEGLVEERLQADDAQ
ncbi:MAG: sulfur transferase domain-containing protein [Woeseiaceae bacterium]|nr:sulfur transferase domain-containing protein [Woeseiaceae bacterium]